MFGKISDALGSVGSFLGKNSASLIGSGAGLVGSFLKNHHDDQEVRAASARSYNYWRLQQQNYYPLLRKSLEDAGYNPLLALNGMSGVTSMPAAGTSAAPDYVGSAVQGANMAREMERDYRDRLKEEEEQRKIATEQGKKNLDVTEAQKDKIEAETKSIKSQEFRNWVESVGGLIGDGTEALLLFNLVRDKLKKGIYGDGSSVGNPISIRGPRAGGESLRRLAPLIKSSAKYGLPLLGLGLGATGIYYGLNNGLPRDSPKKTGFYNRNEDRKSQGGYYPHGNWSR